MAAFIDSLRRTYRFGNAAMKLVLVNVGIFILLRIAALILTLAGCDVQECVLQWIELPSSLQIGRASCRERVFTGV